MPAQQWHPRPVLVRSVQQDAPLSSSEQERFDKIAEALVAKLQDLPDDDVAVALEGGERHILQPPPPGYRPACKPSPRMLGRVGACH